MTIFKSGFFELSSGASSFWKIECDNLTDDDLATLARLIAERLPRFGHVIGVPRGGLRIAKALTPYIASNTSLTLIADDVLTTGASMEKYRTANSVGAVIFARAPCPDWIRAVFHLSPPRI